MWLYWELAMSVSLIQLAKRAKVLPPLTSFSEQAWLTWLEEGWKEFVFNEGRVFTDTYELPIVPGTQIYDLPEDYREMKMQGLYFYYTPRVIASISRSTNVVTVETTLAHNLAIGHTVDLADVTPDSFNGEATVVSVPTTTTFTFAQTDDDESGSVMGTVNGINADMQFPVYCEETYPPQFANWNTEQGEPGYYYFPDSLHVGFFMVPNGSFPTAWLRYDANVPSDWDSADDLPIPGYLEKGLLGYARREAGKTILSMSEKSQTGQALLTLGETDWQIGCKLWRKTQTTREQIGAPEVYEDTGHALMSE
jgi:hypothetical protein